ncbi:MAG TPA: hypothetical protein VNP97_05070 [Microbacterium sp.]|nr:hypothetical protein [Microbacterium sp.]
MNNEDKDFNEPSDEGTAGTPGEGLPTDRRPLGYWLRTVDGLITREFAAAFDGEGASRRDWMLLNALSGDVDVPGLAARLARKGKRLRGLEDRGWVEESGDGTWVLTDEGRAAKERLGSIVDGIRSRVAGAVSPEDFATTMGSLEAIARELGWDENVPMPRRGFGRSFGRGPGFGFGPGSHFGERGAEDCRSRHGHDEHHPHGGHDGHDEHGGHGGHRQGGRRSRGRGERFGRHSESAYERGFDAGFVRGQGATPIT